MGFLRQKYWSGFKTECSKIRKKINVIEDKLINSIQTEYAEVEKLKKNQNTYHIIYTYTYENGNYFI